MNILKPGLFEPSKAKSNIGAWSRRGACKCFIQSKRYIMEVNIEEAKSLLIDWQKVSNITLL